MDAAKVDALNAGHSYISDIPSERLQRVAGSRWQVAGGRQQVAEPGHLVTPSPGHLVAATDYSVLTHCDAAIICVPTPLNKTLDPDVRDHDPYVAEFAHNGHGLRSEADLAQALAEADCVVVVTDHSVYDWRQLAQMPVAVVDTRHVIGRSLR